MKEESPWKKETDESLVMGMAGSSTESLLDAGESDPDGSFAVRARLFLFRVPGFLPALDIL